MKKVLIFGSGSIGNHFANALSRLGDYDIYITDISNKSLLRMKNKIYPERYGKWNKKIKLISYSDSFDLKLNLFNNYWNSARYSLTLYKLIKKSYHIKKF